MTPGRSSGVGRTALRAARAFDGSQELTETVVTVEDGVIVSVESGTSAAQRQVDVDLGDCTLLPGLIDTHTHLVWDASPAPQDRVALETPERTVLRAASHAVQHLRAGETTVRDLGATGALSVPLAQAIAEGEVPGPRVIPCGRAIAMTGGHGWYLCHEADGPDAVRAAVRSEIKHGARAIKLIASGGVYGENERPEEPQLSRAEVEVAVEEAHKAGCLVAAHAYSPVVIDMLLDVGVDSIEHGSLLDAHTAQRMRQQGVALVPTLCVFDAIHSAYADQPGSPITTKAAEIRTKSLEACRVAAEHGVTIAVGTDSGAPGNPHGAVAQEMQLMVEAGLSPAQALHAATAAAAEVIGLADTVGQLTEGHAADLVAVRGNPMAEIQAVRDVALVMLGGRVVVGA
ncbi:amidohydrolase family protein [Streptomyces bathyalis]|uniref:Amidohydrolase family protein n=1 Tax=Streptomyces bathyalis TaxID=2710756 RepID=A0A7T1TBY6_9ACTN|nr:amidohydrolase family protein [Streptomyces bathyalis]QPP10183.1 amidohydrolase family protein [Streptomyces bathyalis]